MDDIYIYNDPGDLSDMAREAHIRPSGPDPEGDGGTFADLMDAFREYGEGQRELMFEIRRAREMVEETLLW